MDKKKFLLWVIALLIGLQVTGCYWHHDHDDGYYYGVGYYDDGYYGRGDHDRGNHHGGNHNEREEHDR